MDFFWYFRCRVWCFVVLCVFVNNQFGALQVPLAWRLRIQHPTTFCILFQLYGACLHGTLTPLEGALWLFVPLFLSHHSGTAFCARCRGAMFTHVCPLSPVSWRIRRGEDDRVSTVAVHCRVGPRRRGLAVVRQEEPVCGRGGAPRVPWTGLCRHHRHP